MNESASQMSSQPEPRRPYATPTLRKYGTIDEITAIKPGGSSDVAAFSTPT